MLSAACRVVGIIYVDYTNTDTKYTKWVKIATTSVTVQYTSESDARKRSREEMNYMCLCLKAVVY